MARPEQIASALLSTDLPNSNVAGVLLEMADVNGVVYMPTPPAASSVQKLLKKGWAKVATAVASGTPEFLGSTLVKHSSVQVRRLLAEHTTDIETLQSLHAWGLVKDRDTFRYALGRLAPEWLVEYLESGAVGYESGDVQVVANRVVTEQPALFDRLMALESGLSHVIAYHAAPQVADGAVPGWSLTRLVAAMPIVSERIARSVTAYFNGTVTTEIVQALMSTPESSQVVSSNGFPRATSFDADAARLLINNNPILGVQITQTDWPHEIFADIVALQRLDVAEMLLCNKSRAASLTKEELSSLIISVADADPSGERYRPSSLNQDLLSFIQFELDTEVLHAYLRNSTETATWSWLSGLTPQSPRPGEVAALIERPGLAFGYNMNYGGTRTFTAATRDEIAYATAARLNEISAQPWADELVDACGSAIIDEMLGSWNSGASYLTSRLTRELGDQSEVWRDAIIHISRSKLSLGQSLNAIRKLRGISKPAQETTAGSIPQQLSFDTDVCTPA